MKYIDAEKLIAEIEMRIAQWQSYTFACASQIASEAFDRIDELKGLLIYITSLQQEQPEVDLEKELDRIWFDNKLGDYFNNDALDYAHIKTLCKHFCELGLNARKEE